MPLGVISHRRVRLRLRTASWTPASFVREVVWCLHLRVGAAHSHGLRRGGVVSCVFLSRRHIILSFPTFICCFRSHCSSRCLASCRFIALSCILKILSRISQRLVGFSRFVASLVSLMCQVRCSLLETSSLRARRGMKIYCSALSVGAYKLFGSNPERSIPITNSFALSGMTNPCLHYQHPLSSPVSH